MAETKITEAEWMAELDKMREDVALALTDEQFKVIRYGRTKEPRVPYTQIMEYMKEHNMIDKTTPDSRFRHRYYAACEKRGLSRE